MFNVHIHSKLNVCHGHRYRPSLVPLSRTEKKEKKKGGGGGRGSKGGPHALAGTREYEQSDRNR